MWEPSIRQKAITLRKRGFTQREIREMIPHLPKGTLSAWLKDISLTSVQKKAIIARADSFIERGRERAGFTLQKNRLEREKKARNEAKAEFCKFKNTPLFLMGLMLYWAEGSKKGSTFQFMNSDPRLVIFIIRWLKNTYHIKLNKIKLRLFIHTIYAHEQPEKYWRKRLSFPKTNFLKTVYKSSPHLVKRNPNYHGCMRVEVQGMHLFRKILYTYDLISKKYHLI